MAAYYEVVALAGFTHERPDYAIESVEVRGDTRAVTQRIATRTPFCNLLHFQKEGGADDPQGAACSADVWPFCDAAARHGRARCCATIRSTSPTGSTRATSSSRPAASAWRNTPSTSWISSRHIGDECHIVAVCQPCVSALAATAVMAMDGANVQPASLTLMAGPIDARILPNKVNKLATEKPFEWFRDNLIGVVPWKIRGPRPARLSRLPPAFRLHEHESGAPFARPSSISTTPASTANTTRPRRSRNSTRNISRSWT